MLKNNIKLTTKKECFSTLLQAILFVIKLEINEFRELSCFIKVMSNCSSSFKLTFHFNICLAVTVHIDDQINPPVVVRFFLFQFAS